MKLKKVQITQLLETLTQSSLNKPILSKQDVADILGVRIRTLENYKIPFKRGIFGNKHYVSTKAFLYCWFPLDFPKPTDWAF